MPRRKNAIAKIKNRNGLQNILNQLTWGESYTSLLLGILVVIVSAVIFVSFVKSRGVFQTTPKEEVSSTSTEKSKEEEKGTRQVSSYTVVADDTLWSISEKVYESGYNWVDIATANKLENPGVIEIGQKLTIPKAVIAPAQETTQSPPQKVTTNTYTVVEDDTLWDIAVRAYGDGFRWIEIAKANNLENPDLIFPGNSFILSR